MEISSYFVSLVALVPLVVLITDFLIRWLKVLKPWIKQVISWVIAVGLCLVGMWFDLGMFAEFTAGTTIAYGIAAGLVANGIFDMKIIQTLLDILLKFIPKNSK
jgi:hypothetical protein